MFKNLTLLFFTFLALISQSQAQELLYGIDRPETFMAYLKGKKVSIVANSASIDKSGKHLIDILREREVVVRRVYAPEHGLRGTADAGEKISDSVDKATGIPISSLYGNRKKPEIAQLKGLDYVVYDLQDVGVRFFTYISTLQYVMEACSEAGIPLMILDRPNPHGNIVDGPVLDTGKFRSFVGMQPIPIMYGMTCGEYARMLNGEGWLAKKRRCQLQIIEMAGYDPSNRYSLRVKPSPNLPNSQAVGLYPSLCWFEGTPISVGRGTDLPFQIIGAPFPELGKYYFKPQSLPGAKTPPHLGKDCFGQDLSKAGIPQGVTLKYLIEMYERYPQKDKFFQPFFEKLAGNARLKNQIAAGLGEASIKATWVPELRAFKAVRKRYILYKE